jgi:hypothetical protein
LRYACARKSTEAIGVDSFKGLTGGLTYAGFNFNAD